MQLAKNGACDMLQTYAHCLGHRLIRECIATRRQTFVRWQPSTHQHSALSSEMTGGMRARLISTMHKPSGTLDAIHCQEERFFN